MRSGVIGLALAVWSLHGTASAQTVSLSANDQVMNPGSIADVVVSGEISGQTTYGVTILVELAARPGAVGTLTFTAAPPDDITELGDPWPGAGLFSSYDTDLAGHDYLNGAINDNGTFLLESTTYSGVLASFPVVSSTFANGTWDVRLTTSFGPSTWETIPTTLFSGTITVANPNAIPSTSHWGITALILLLLTAGTLTIEREHAYGPALHNQYGRLPKAHT